MLNISGLGFLHCKMWRHVSLHSREIPVLQITNNWRERFESCTSILDLAFISYNKFAVFVLRLTSLNQYVHKANAPKAPKLLVKWRIWSYVIDTRDQFLKDKVVRTEKLVWQHAWFQRTATNLFKGKNPELIQLTITNTWQGKETNKME